MLPTEDIIPIVKNTIAASIKCNTHRGYIGWSSCDNICMDMHDCLDMCAETLEKRGYMIALEAASYILVSGVKLASHADSSSGMLTDVIMCTYELIDKCTKEIEKKDKQMRNQALALIIKEAKKSVFDGWTDWRYNLLKSGICLRDEKSAKKLEKVLDTLLEISREDYFPEYTKKEDFIVRYLLHRHLYGKENTQEELYQNILINELRIIAIKDAMEEKNYDEAEKLCLEKANAENTWHYRSGDPEEDRPEDIEAARKAYFSLQEDDSNWTWNVSWWSDPVLLGYYPEEGLERYEKYLPKITEEDMRLISEPIDIYGQNIYNGRCIRMGEDGKP